MGTGELMTEAEWRAREKRADTYRLAILEEAPVAASPEQSDALDRFLMMAVLRAGSVPTGAHNPDHRGSTPRPATISAPAGALLIPPHSPLLHTPAGASHWLDGIARLPPRTPSRRLDGSAGEYPRTPMSSTASGRKVAP